MPNIRFGYLLNIIATFVGRKILPTKKHEIVILKIDAFGDFLLWLYTAHAIKHAYSDKRITLIVSENLVSFASQFPFWDQIIPFNPTRYKFEPRYRLTTISAFSQLNCDKILNPVRSRSHLNDELVNLISSQEVIGFEADGFNSSIVQANKSNYLYTKLVSIEGPYAFELSSLKIFNDAILACESFKSPINHLSIDHKAQVDHDYYLIFPSSGWYGRNWPIGNFVQLIDKIYSQYCLIPVISGMQCDAPIAEEIAKQCSVPVTLATGKYTISSLASIIQKSKFVVGNESGPVHYSAMLNTPSVCILGGGHFGRFMPYPPSHLYKAPITCHFPMPCFNCNWHCHHEDYQVNLAVPCIRNVSVLSVFDAISKILTNDA